MNSIQNLWIGVVIAIALAIIGIFTPLGHQAAQVADQAGAILDYATHDFAVETQGLWITNQPAGTLAAPSDANGVETAVRVGSCATASSTLFAVASPFNGATTGFAAGTSTAYLQVFGTQGATTTDLIVGTSSTAFFPGQLATSSLNATLLGATGLATTTPFYLSSGNTLSWNKGTYTNNSEVQVTPTQFVVGFSTSTYGGSLNGGLGAAQVAVPASCTYKITFYR